MDEESAGTSVEMDNKEFLPGYETVSSFTQSCYGKLVKATQKAHGLPTPGDDHEFYSSFPDFRDFCKSQGTRTLSNIGKIIKYHHIKCRWFSELDDAPSMDVDDMFESVVEANDILLEQIDSCLDEASGLRKNKKPVLPSSMKQSSPVVTSWNKSPHHGRKQDDKLSFLHAKNILRPQLKFRDKPDNSNVPFVPIISEKPNAMKPLENYSSSTTDISEDVPAALADFIHAQRTQETVSQCHPYQFELEEFQPDPEAMIVSEPRAYSSMEETELIYVDNVDKLTQMLSILRNVKEFAVDLEHHSFRSFQGIVCLMQMSTRDQDFLVDTLELRSELSQLNEVFTDPNILKVLHGADMDVGWLQRDFGIYVVNMFDTGQATRVLEYPRFSLAFLLQKFCDVTADKQYQLADWRIRPLPAEMEYYARQDTHYLLYIYDCLRNELVSKGNENKNLVESVYRRSRDVCLKRYEKPLFTAESYLSLYHKHKKPLNPHQLEAFRLLFAWRDGVARLEDESYAYVLPNHMLFGVAEELPKASQGVLACCNPVPTLVRKNVSEIHQLIMQARDFAPPSPRPSASNLPTVAPPDSTDINQSTATSAITKNGDKDVLEVSQQPMVAFRDLSITGPAVKVVKPEINLFACGEKQKSSTGEMKAREIEESLRNPFQAFLPAKAAEDVVKKSSKEINEQWKKKSEEMIEEENENGRDEKNGKDETMKRKSVEQDEEEVVLRQPKVKKKKDKVLKAPEKSEGSSKDGKFVPFDYSSVGSSFSKDSGTEKEIFDPFKKLNEKGKQFSSKVRMKSGQRSMTFGKKK